MRQLPSTTQGHNWLVHRIVHDYLVHIIPKYARGDLVDIGCGSKPWKYLFEPHVQRYIGVDHAESLHDLSEVDVVANAYETRLDDACADTVFCQAVLEHLEQPQRALCEMARVLKPGGYLILTAPMFWHLHEEPRDFYRYTPFGLKHLVETAGMELVETIPLSGFWVTFLQELCYVLRFGIRARLLRPLASGCIYLIQRFAYLIRRWDTDTRFSWMCLAVGRKPLESMEQPH